MEITESKDRTLDPLSVENRGPEELATKMLCKLNPEPHGFFGPCYSLGDLCQGVEASFQVASKTASIRGKLLAKPL